MVVTFLIHMKTNSISCFHIRVTCLDSDHSIKCFSHTGQVLDGPRVSFEGQLSQIQQLVLSVVSGSHKCHMFHLWISEVNVKFANKDIVIEVLRNKRFLKFLHRLMAILG